jgi:hypothetical protein
MKQSWLLLALSVTCLLFLAPAAALAQEISIRTDPEGCTECRAQGEEMRYLALYSSGWLDDELITIDEWKDGQHVDTCPSCGGAINGVFNHPVWRDFPCSEGDQVLGEWRYRLTGDTSGRVGEVTVLVAEDCTASEFVPEPGTLLLFGSGLMSVGAYTVLRLRSRLGGRRPEGSP